MSEENILPFKVSLDDRINNNLKNLEDMVDDLIAGLKIEIKN